MSRLENDGVIAECYVIGDGNWISAEKRLTVKCSHCADHMECGVCDNGNNLAGTLYRMWGRSPYACPDPVNELLYIGMTQNLFNRTFNRRAVVWTSDIRVITVEHYYSMDALKRAEENAIRTENPIHNVRGIEDGVPDQILGVDNLKVIDGGE